MENFENVTAVPKANVYFDGKVVSRNLIMPDGSKKTLGYMQAGEYEFSTGAEELMEVIEGSMDVLLPGETEWKTFGPGEAYKVSGNSKFQVKVPDFTDYCCSYR